MKNKNKKNNNNNKAENSQLYSIKMQISYLKRLNRKDRLSIFLGAGISVSCGLPDWDTLLESLKSLIDNHGIYVSEDADIANTARKIFGDEFNSVVADCLYKHGLNISDSVRSVAHSGVNNIVCFNFDDILEELFRTECLSHNVVLNGEKFNINETNHTTIFHPHGYLGRFDSKLEQEKSNIVLSKSDYDNLYQDHYCLTNLIKISILMTKTVIFVGMSMTDPNTIRLLKEIRNIGADSWHYAFMKIESEDHLEGETKRLRSLGVYPVWYQEHSDIPGIMKQLSK